MTYTFLAAVIVAIALLVVLFAAKLLINKGWFLGWLRGMAGVCLFAIAVTFTLSALDLYSYRQLAKEQAIASISFEKVSPQQFKVSLVDSNGAERFYELSGDLWQLDARILRWESSLRGLGLQSGYRLDRLSGRYYSLEKETSQQRTVYELGDSKSSIDIWRWLQDYGRALSIVNASYGSATYLPMEDGALFSVKLSNSGLLALPLNDRAQAAVERWR